MRWAQRSAMLVVAFVAVSMLTAPNTIAMVVTPNPNPPNPNKLKGDGTYQLDPGYMLGGVRFETTLKGTTQVTFAIASASQGKWDSTLSVTPGTYNPTTVTMTLIDANKMVSTVALPNKNDQVVN